jgi:hypothetical protein
LPKVGERIREYRQDEETGKITHGREGEWMIRHIHPFSSLDTDQRIYSLLLSVSTPSTILRVQAIAKNWETLQRGQSVDQMISTPVP